MFLGFQPELFLDVFSVGLPCLRARQHYGNIGAGSAYPAVCSSAYQTLHNWILNCAHCQVSRCVSSIKSITYILLPWWLVTMVLGLHSAPGNTSAGMRRWLGAALKVVRVCPTSRQILQNMKSNTSWASVAPWVWVCHHPVWGLIISSLCGEAWDHHRGGCGIPRLRTFVEKFFVNVKTLFYAERRAQVGR